MHVYRSGVPTARFFVVVTMDADYFAWGLLTTGGSVIGRSGHLFPDLESAEEAIRVVQAAAADGKLLMWSTAIAGEWYWVGSAGQGSVAMAKFGSANGGAAARAGARFLDRVRKADVSSVLRVSQSILNDRVAPPPPPDKVTDWTPPPGRVEPIRIPDERFVKNKKGTPATAPEKDSTDSAAPSPRKPTSRAPRSAGGMGAHGSSGKKPRSSGTTPPKPRDGNDRPQSDGKA